MFERAQSLAIEAGRIALSHFNRAGSIATMSKGHLDLVTVADREVERFLVEELHRAYPEDAIFGEEGGGHAGASGRTWVVDPIDGTFNFVRGSDEWAISVGLLRDGVPEFGVLHVPVREHTFVGGKSVQPTLNGKPMRPRTGLDRSRGASGVGFNPSVLVADRLEILRYLLEDKRVAIRCGGSATIALIEAAMGQVDGYIGIGEASWDLVAAMAIFAPIGIVSTIDWKNADLSGKFSHATGTADFVDAMEPVLRLSGRFEAVPSGALRA